MSWHLSKDSVLNQISQHDLPLLRALLSVYDKAGNVVLFLELLNESIHLTVQYTI